MIVPPNHIAAAGPGVALSEHADGLAVAMADPNPDLADARNAVTLTYDLSALQQVRLDFEARESGDEPHAPPAGAFFGDDAAFDGVAISVDGVDWYEVQGLRQLRSDRWTSFDLDLDAAIAAAGLFHAPQFRLRFCQTDNMPRLMDGIALRGIRLSGEPWTAPEPELLLHLPMDDSAPTPLVRDLARRHHQSFLDPAGDARTQAHSVEGPHGPGSRALSFDGVNDRIVVGTAWLNEILAAGHDFAFCLWWKNPASPFTDSQRYVFTCSTVHLANRINTAGEQFTSAVLRRSTGGSIYPELTGLNDGLWHHYVLARRGETLEVWLDGVRRTANSHPDNAGNMAAPLFVINGPDTANYAPGALADFRVYGRALSEAEMHELYAVDTD